MSITKVKKSLAKLVPKRFKRPSLIEQRDSLKSLRLKILANHPVNLLREIEETVKTKGTKSKELSVLKSKVAMDFNEKYFGFRLTQAARNQAAELMNQLEQRERSVQAIGRKKSEDKTAIELRKKLESIFSSKKEFDLFIASYRLYSSELSLLLRKAGY